MRIGVIGGGVLGLSLAYYLSGRGATVTVFEGKERAGGLLDYFSVDGAWIDKYYHCILTSDAELLGLVDELGLSDRVRFAETRQGVYYGGKTYPLASGKDFLLFPPLSLIERFRLGLGMLRALRVSDWPPLEEIPVERWLVSLCGQGVFDKLWQPLLNAKFDGQYQQTPATYIWSRLKRTSSTRAQAGQQERMGYFVGSYKVLVDRLVERIAERGSAVRLGARVRQLTVEQGRVTGVQLDDGTVPCDAVVVTTPLPVLARLLPEAERPRLAVPETSTYLGVVCGLALLDRGLTPYYTLNLADTSIPLTGLIETTTLIRPEHVGGYHLVYLPRYVTPNSPFAAQSDGDLRALYLTQLRRMFPAFREDWVRHLFVFRERFVEPLHQIGKPRPVLPLQGALPGLFILNNGQIYPELTNCQASVRHALGAVPAILGQTPAEVLAGTGLSERG
jgi:protoporphyrinogen oxidase